MSSFTDFSATTCIKTHRSRVLSYRALEASVGWLPRFTGSSTSFTLRLHQLWHCAKLRSWLPYLEHQPQLSSPRHFWKDLSLVVFLPFSCSLLCCFQQEVLKTLYTSFRPSSYNFTVSPSGLVNLDAGKSSPFWVTDRLHTTAWQRQGELRLPSGSRAIPAIYGTKTME